MSSVASLACTATLLVAAAACAAPAASPTSVGFESGAVWILHGSDSTRLTVEIADTQERQEVGLSGRERLAPEVGMLFVFDSPRYGGDGFQMWRTSVPLDVAFMNAGGEIVRILSMEPCAARRAEDCPGYYPGVEYATALEVARGWLAGRGIGVGATVRIDR